MCVHSITVIDRLGVGFFWVPVICQFRGFHSCTINLKIVLINQNQPDLPYLYEDFIDFVC